MQIVFRYVSTTHTEVARVELDYTHQTHAVVLPLYISGVVLEKESWVALDARENRGWMGSIPILRLCLYACYS